MGVYGSRVLLFALSGIAMIAATQLAAAKTWQGTWKLATGQGGSATLEFVSGNQVKYCFNSSCVVQAYSGSEKGTVKFSWGQASYSFKWNGHGYNGTYNGTQGASPVAIHATIVMN
jgi:hypothetical protein